MATNDSEHSFLSHKIDTIETRLEGHVSKIEQRLDQLVHLMQAVASLQEKESRNADSVTELKKSMKESIDKFDKSVERIHARFDKIDDEQEKDLDAMFEKSLALEEKIGTVNEKVAKWMNRGIGLWIGISGLVVILQTVGGMVLSSFKDEYSTTKAQIVEMAKRQNELENDLSRINNSIRALQSGK